MKSKLENRNALITGASRGIGQAIATRFAEEGANLFICARTTGPLEEAAAGLRRFGGKVVTYCVDVSKPEIGPGDGSIRPQGARSNRYPGE